MTRVTAAMADQSPSTGEERRLEQAVGLCGSCAHAEGCVLRREGTVVQFCEEFEVLAGESRRVFPAVASTEPVEAAEGLCATCLNRDDCRLRAVDGSVWFCEEYE